MNASPSCTVTTCSRAGASLGYLPDRSSCRKCGICMQAGVGTAADSKQDGTELIGTTAQPTSCGARTALAAGASAACCVGAVRSPQRSTSLAQPRAEPSTMGTSVAEKAARAEGINLRSLRRAADQRGPYTGFSHLFMQARVQRHHR